MPGLYAAAALNGLGLVLGLVATLADGIMLGPPPRPAAHVLAQPGPGLPRDFAEIPAATRLVRRGAVESVEAIALLEAGDFASLNLPLLRGEATTALARPGNIVLTRRLALKYFGGIDCLGRTLEIGGTASQVTGIAEDTLPAAIGGFMAQ